jgi:transposase, IS30 family
MTEREEISRGVAAGEPCRQIAARLGRAPSTVSRELARNGGPGRYRAQAADAAAFRRAQRPKPAKLVLEPRLRAVVQAKLALRWSPQQIAGWLPLAYPSDPVMRVSHETIYLSLFVQSRGALRRELQRCLRTGRAMRYPRGKRLPQGRGQLRDTLHISQRPPEAADRAVPGHWEGDLVFGKRPSAVGTLVERHSRYVLLFPLPDGFTAERMRPALTAAVLRLPQQLRHSLTWDHGREMAEHAQFTIDSGVQVLLRPAQPLAARHQRKYQRPAPPIPGQEQRPAPLRPARTRRHRRGAQRPSSTNPWLSDTLTGPGGGVALTP